MSKTTLKGAQAGLHARTTLVLFHRDGAQVAPLPAGRAVVIGRAAPADVQIPDPGLSRQHARFLWDERGIWVEDLGSTNGTKKNGAPITRAQVGPGDEIEIGPVRVSVHVIAASDDELRGFDGHDRFVAALADELTRARTFARSLSLLLLRSAAQPVSRWASRVRAQLRPVDRVGLYGPAAMLVSLPEASPEAVRTLLALLATDPARLAGKAVLFPGDGGSVEELIAALQVTAPTGAAGAAAPATAAVVASSPAMREVMATIKRLAPSTISVLLHGETGTGKEVIARAIHDAGPRKKRPLRSINCAAIPGQLIESVLFGHEQGAFTSADKATKGIFEQAEGGTVLLDEIGELAAPAQAALLRALETRKVTRVGGDREIDVDVRVISATHRDLEAMAEAGRFRHDLLYRLNTITLYIPPLRDRVDEIRPLAERFLDEARRQTASAVRSIDPAALAALEAYPWPGNVRELRNIIERAVVLAEGKAITLAELTARVRAGAAPAEPAPGDDAPGDDAPGDDAPGDYRERVRRYEAELIRRALHKHAGNQTAAAKALGLPLRTLVHKLQTYGIKKKF